MDTTTTAPEGAIQPKTHLTGKVIKTTIAGAILDVGQKVLGVVHISQLRSEPVNRVEDVIQVGQTVDAWVRRVRDDRIELTMIKPLTLEWRELKPEMVVKGKVARLESYGAFVDIGAERPGLVHVSEISHDYVKMPSEVLKEGDEVETKILEVDRRKKQIRLSIKATQPKPEEVPAEVKAEKKDRQQNREDRGQGRKRKAKKDEAYVVAESEPKEPEPTSMEIAWQEAKDRAESKKNKAKAKKAESEDMKEREDIFDRTLENRLPTG